MEPNICGAETAEEFLDWLIENYDNIDISTVIFKRTVRLMLQLKPLGLDITCAEINNEKLECRWYGTDWNLTIELDPDQQPNCYVRNNRQGIYKSIRFHVGEPLPDYINQVIELIKNECRRYTS